MRKTGVVAVALAAIGLMLAPALPSSAAPLDMRSVAGFGEGGACTLNPAGGEGNEDSADVALFDRPGSVDFAPNGDMIIADTDNHRIRRVNAVTRRVTTIAGRCRNQGADGDGGLAITARLHFPTDVAVDTFGHIFVVDTFNHRIRRIDRVTGRISTVAGNGIPASADYDGAVATSVSLDHPYGIDIDGSRLYITDAGGKRVHRVSTTTGLIETIRLDLGKRVDPNRVDVTDPLAGDPRDVAPADVLRYPTAIRVQTDGRLLVVDSFDNRVVRIDPRSRQVETIAGLGDRELEGTGHGTYTSLSFPFGLEVDRRGNIFVGDANRGTIEMITPAGAIVPIAGFSVPWLKDHNDGDAGDDGPALMAKMSGPGHLRIAGDGNLYVADRNNHRIRMIDLP